MGIGLKLTVDGETPIQTLSEQLESTVKKNVEEISGVVVNQISVYFVLSGRQSVWMEAEDEKVEIWRTYRGALQNLIYLLISKMT
ncbi:hypothetical protein SAMN05444487_10462 [Marininema mesophilum]|uniref:Uncharacterized protein n=1 Tax=Marininema mesophilum TaxID=1048340 RepID=A0A1H2UCT1_9BACL|nr:hypothetical protein [Marininema mesophilum]SDW53708.1 hypothetical protein SAMN05444487_10462 [Marininema mesophilum]